MNRIRFILLFPILILAIACNKEPANPAEINLDWKDEGINPITFTEGFESGSYEPNWETHLDGATPEVEVLKTAARAGKYAARFKTTGANGDRRSELVPEIPRFEWYRQYWLGFSFKVTTPVEESGIIFQHHSTPGDKNWQDCTAGPNSFTSTNGNRAICSCGTIDAATTRGMISPATSGVFCAASRYMTSIR